MEHDLSALVKVNEALLAEQGEQDLAERTWLEDFAVLVKAWLKGNWERCSELVEQVMTNATFRRAVECTHQFQQAICDC